MRKAGARGYVALSEEGREGGRDLVSITLPLHVEGGRVRRHIAGIFF